MHDYFEVLTSLGLLAAVVVFSRSTGTRDFGWPLLLVTLLLAALLQLVLVVAGDRGTAGGPAPPGDRVATWLGSVTAWGGEVPQALVLLLLGVSFLAAGSLAWAGHASASSERKDGIVIRRLA